MAFDKVIGCALLPPPTHPVSVIECGADAAEPEGGAVCANAADEQKSGIPQSAVVFMSVSLVPRAARRPPAAYSHVMRTCDLPSSTSMLTSSIDFMKASNSAPFIFEKSPLIFERSRSM